MKRTPASKEISLLLAPAHRGAITNHCRLIDEKVLREHVAEAMRVTGDSGVFEWLSVRFLPSRCAVCWRTLAGPVRILAGRTSNGFHDLFLQRYEHGDSGLGCS